MSRYMTEEQRKRADAEEAAWYAAAAAEEAAQRAAETQWAEDWRANLPPLVGSPKQIAWADKIRAKVIGKIEIRYPMERNRKEERWPLVDCVTRAEAEMILRQTAAAWWIDRRHRSLELGFDHFCNGPKDPT